MYEDITRIKSIQKEIGYEKFDKALQDQMILIKWNSIKEGFNLTDQ